MSAPSKQQQYDRLDAATSAYERAFGSAPVTTLFGVSLSYMAEVLERSVAQNQPVPAEFDWYAHLPTDAVA